MLPDLKPRKLDERVLRWTLKDITTPNLFKKEVSVIPMEFTSMDEYLRVFRVPLQEEVRAQVHQALEKSINVQRKRCTISTTIRKILTRKRTRSGSTKLVLELELISNNLQVKNSDLILLCSHKPRWDKERDCLLKSYDDLFVLACVAHAEEDSPVISGTVYLQDESSVLTNLCSIPSLWHVVLLGVSLTPARRIWDAISVPFESEQVSRDSITHSVLQIDQRVGMVRLLLPQTLEGAETMRLSEAYGNSRGLNESQKGVMKSALAALLAGDAKPHVRVVQGPPGTGKTSMLVTLISVLGCLQRRILVSAPTNAAVVEISKRTMNFFLNSKNEEMFSEFCSRINADSNRCILISLSDLVLLGNKKNLKLQQAVKGTVLERIFLDNRILRLQEALSLIIGWKASVLSVVKFLTAAPALFEAEESKNKRAQERGVEGLKTPKKKPVMRNDSFWSFSRKSMFDLQAQMKKTSDVLTHELPRCYLDMKTSSAMTRASNLMVNLVNLMPKKAPAKAKTWFSTTTTKNTLCETFAGLNLSKGGSATEKMKFLQARVVLLEALKLGPGCALFASKENPEGMHPSMDWLKAECLRNATVVFSTVSGAGSRMMEGATFECAIIDEASQLVEAETTIITRMKGLKQLILVGDHKQLPATVISKVAEKCGYRRSLFDRLQALQYTCRHLLNIQYRMKPAISRFPNSKFYDGKVNDGPNVMSPTYGSSLNAAAFGTYAFLDCKSGTEVAQQKSWKNPQEVMVVVGLVTALGKVCAARNLQTLSVGVISPYGMQVEALQDSLHRQALHQALHVEVKTVDGFQGNERDVIIFSAVRSNHSKRIGFVDDCRRLNVAITRGRYCVWIIGNATTLSGGSKIWKKLVTDAKARKCFHAL